MKPVGRRLGLGYLPRDVTKELLVYRVVHEAVGKVHGDLSAFGTHGQFGAHTPVRESLLRTGVILHDVPCAEELQ